MPPWCSHTDESVGTSIRAVAPQERASRRPDQAVTRPLVSFVVPTVDRRNELERFLRSADAQPGEHYELLVVDAGSECVEEVALRHRNVRYLRSPHRGLSRNRNLAIAHARGEWLVFADDDCVLAADYLQALTEQVVPSLDDREFAFGNAVSLEDGLPLVPTFRPARRSVGSWACDTLCSISLVLGRQTVERAGGFDEEFGLGARFPAGEETDLLLRLCEAGGRGIYCQALTVMHPRRSRTRDLVSRYEGYGYAHGALARKHVHNGPCLVRFAYGLVRAFGGMTLEACRGQGLAQLHRASLRGRLRGFRAYAEQHR